MTCFLCSSTTPPPVTLNGHITRQILLFKDLLNKEAFAKGLLPKKTDSLTYPSTSDTDVDQSCATCLTRIGAVWELHREILELRGELKTIVGRCLFEHGGKLTNVKKKVRNYKRIQEINVPPPPPKRDKLVENPPDETVVTDAIKISTPRQYRPKKPVSTDPPPEIIHIETTPSTNSYRVEDNPTINMSTPHLPRKCESPEIIELKTSTNSYHIITTTSAPLIRADSIQHDDPIQDAARQGRTKNPAPHEILHTEKNPESTRAESHHGGSPLLTTSAPLISTEAYYPIKNEPTDIVPVKMEGGEFEFEDAEEMEMPIMSSPPHVSHPVIISTKSLSTQQDNDEDRPFECSRCGGRFARKVFRNRHVARCTGARI